MSAFENNAIFWIEVEKIRPNPYQPRRNFDEARLRDLADSIRQYGVLQPLTVTRNEIIRDDGGISVEYELIAGERRHRASKLAGVRQVPVIIKTGAENDKLKLELAIIENLQREDLNPIERARAFDQLANEFDFSHTEIAKKIGKSREYVSNSIRLLSLPEHIQNAIMEGKLTEGHARPLMMLKDRPDEQETLFKEVVFKKITVREAEGIARKIATDKARKKTKSLDPRMLSYEKRLSETLGTRVQIESKDVGGKVVINFFTPDDLESILEVITSDARMTRRGVDALLNKFISSQEGEDDSTESPEASEPHTPDTASSDGDATHERVAGEVVSDDSDENETIAVEQKDSAQPEENSTPHNEVTTRNEEVPTEGGSASEGNESVADSTSNGESEESSPALSKDEGDKKEEESEEDLYSVSNFSL